MAAVINTNIQSLNAQLAQRPTGSRRVLLCFRRALLRGLLRRRGVRGLGGTRRCCGVLSGRSGSCGSCGSCYYKYLVENSSNGYLAKLI